MLKLLWNIIYKNNGNLLCQLLKKYCEQKLKCQKTNQNRLKLLLNCAVFGKKKWTFTKNKELHNFNDQFKMNKIMNKFLLTGDKFIPKSNFKQPGFTHSASGFWTIYLTS